jgi:hypothetical protein
VPKAVSSLHGKRSFLSPSVSSCCRELVEAG